MTAFSKTLEPLSDGPADAQGSPPARRGAVFAPVLIQPGGVAIRQRTEGRLVTRPRPSGDSIGITAGGLSLVWMIFLSDGR